MTERERLIDKIKKSLFKHIYESCNLSESIADDLLEDGVIVPPCKVGDTVYEIDKDCDGCNHFKEYWGYNCTCKREPEGSLFDVDYDKDCKYSISETPFNHALLNYIGNTVFLTKEEAEDVLRKENEGK